MAHSVQSNDVTNYVRRRMASAQQLQTMKSMKKFMCWAWFFQHVSWY